MKKYILFLLVILDYSVLIYAQNDFFPLEIGNQWDYSYNSIEKEYFDIGFMNQMTMDSGKVQFIVADSSFQDSVIIWDIQERDNIERQIQDFYYNTDTTFSIDINSTFQLFEFLDSLHTIKSESYFEVFTFPVKWERFGNISSTIPITRFSSDTSVLTIEEYKFIIAGYLDTLVFHKNVGLVYAKSIIDKGPNTPYYYKWEATLSSYLTEVADEVKKNPLLFRLEQNYPNPFNPTTIIGFSIPSSNYVEIKVFNVIGKEVATLLSGYLQSGKHSIEFNAKNLSSGIYFYRIQTGNFTDTKKFILLK